MPHKFLISGGGTGGHIFPAVAIARGLEKEYPGCKILFVGANNRMEMEKVPQEGYNIVGLDVAGLKRSLSPSNLMVAWKFIRSYFKARQIVKDFQPDCVIGTGGYASLAVLYAASGMGCKTLIWEGNGYAGLTNKILARRVHTICTGFPGMEKFFPKEKLVFTGNPVRENMLHLPAKDLAASHFNLRPDLPVVFVTGGSLGARSINLAVQRHLGMFLDNQVQLIWQTGKNFKNENPETDHVRVMAFLKEMDLAFAAADVVISRSGALSLAEIAVTGKPAVLVPSPNVTEDHQTQNALQLSSIGAALLIRDHEAGDKLVSAAIDLVKDPEGMKRMQEALKTVARPHATQSITEEIKKLITA